MKRFTHITKKTFVALLLVATVFVVGVRPAQANLPVVDASGTGVAVGLGIADAVATGWDQAWKTTKDILGATGATIYKQAVGGLLNAIAADLAKGIATGNFGGPLFSFDKQYFANLADGVVGDLLNDVVGGLTGIDLCNFNPQLTLSIGLELPFVKTKAGEYEPRCSLSQIADNLESINFKELVSLEVNITTKTYESFGDLLGSFLGDSTIGQSLLAETTKKIGELYAEDSAFNTSLAKDIEAMKKIIESDTPDVSLSDTDLLIKDITDVPDAVEYYLCVILRDVQAYNFGLVNKADFTGTYTFFNDCNGKIDETVKIDPNQFPNQYRDAVLNPTTGWLRTSGGNNAGITSDSDRVLQTLMSNMDKAAQRVSTPIDKAIARSQYVYDQCLAGMQRTLGARLVSSQPTATNVKNKDDFALSLPVVSFSADLDTGATSQTNSGVVYLDIYPPAGKYTEVTQEPDVKEVSVAGSGDVSVVKIQRPERFAWFVSAPAQSEVAVYYTFDGSNPNACGDEPAANKVIVQEGWDSTSGFFRIDANTLVFNDTDADAQSATIKARACVSRLSDGTQLGDSGVKTFSYVVDPGYTMSPAQARGLTQVGGSYRESFPAQIVQTQGAPRPQEVIVTYEQPGAPMTNEEFVACQIAFNGNALLRRFWVNDGVGYLHGANKYPPDGNFSAVVLGQAATLLSGEGRGLGAFRGIFTPSYVQSTQDWFAVTLAKGQQVNNRSEYWQAFIRNTMALDAQEPGRGQEIRETLRSLISTAVAGQLAVQEVLSKQANNIERVFSKGLDIATQRESNQLSSSERINEWSKTFEPEGNESATSFILTKNLLDAQAKKQNEEIVAALEKGTAVNPERSPVSDLAKGPADVIKSRISGSAEGGGNAFAEHTGEIVVDAMAAFLGTLWNEMMIRALSELNPVLQRNPNIFNVDPALQQQIAEQDACRQDASKCSTNVPDYQLCEEADRKVLTSFSRMAKALGENFTTACGSGKVNDDGTCAPPGLTPECQEALQQHIKETSGNVDSFLRAMGGSSITDVFSAVQGLAERLSGRSSPMGVNPADRPELRNIAPFVPRIQENEFAGLNVFASTNYPILQEFIECPTGGQANPSLYNCTIDAKLQPAILEEMTIRQALEKGHLSGSMSVGITADGRVPTPQEGFSLAAVQKLRKARVVPVGMEFAARLKVACYQQQLEEKGGIPDTFAYRDISSECKFKKAGAQQDGYYQSSPSDDDAVVGEYQKHLTLRNAVLRATLQDILDGFEVTNPAFRCGEYEVVNGQALVSPFCNLVNPDWVLKIPTAQCSAFEFGEILENQNSNRRYYDCTELTSDLGDGSQGYCLKEENVWNITGTQCPVEYASCEAFVFRDGSVSAFNKDSLVGSAVCNENNAGCMWVATIKQGLQWVDSAMSRLYINGNVDFCPEGDKGCSEVKLVRYDQNNLVMDGSFEFGEVGVKHPLWNATQLKPISAIGESQNIGGVTEEIDCIQAGGVWTQGSCLATLESVAQCTDVVGGAIVNTCLDVPFTSQQSCEANGGSWDAGATTCTGAVLQNVNAGSCGVCSGGAAAQGFTNQSLCELNNLTWTSGQFVQYCSLQQASCREDRGICELYYQDYDGDQLGCVAVGGNYYPVACMNGDVLIPNVTDESACADEQGSLVQRICLSPQGNRTSVELDDALNDKAQCDLLGGRFRMLCPLVVTNQASDNGNKSLEIETKTEGLHEQDVVLVEYPITIGDNQSQIVLSGDTYRVAFALRADEPTTISAELRKTQNGGRVDSILRRINVGTAFETHTMTMTALTSGTDLTLRIFVDATNENQNIYLDSVKIEYISPRAYFSGDANVQRYTEYSDNVAAFVKLPPDYLQCRGYNNLKPSPVADFFNNEVSCRANGLFWDAGNVYQRGVKCYQYAPDNTRCSEYAPLCEANEAGCQLFTPTNGEPEVPGVVGQNDYCPAQCAGYDAFKQQPSYFEPTPIAPLNYFIPDTATQCSVSAVGCDEFTNLALGEQNAPIEYYTYLRQCIVPNTGLGEAGFFIWQGTNNGTPQLRTFTLQAENLDGTGAPKVISADGFCTAEEAQRNLDCMEFFDSQGNSHFRKYSYTIKADPTCTTLRKTVSNEESCTQTNGEWNGENNTCLYKALPSESRSCSAEVNGCREYFGNTGNNSFASIFDTFESATPHSWYNTSTEQNPQQKPAISSESITRLGRSLFVEATVNEINRSVRIVPGRAYKVSFWAKHGEERTKSLGVRFANTTHTAEFARVTTNEVQVNADWRYFEVGPVFINEDENTADNRLIFENAGNVFFDNITVTNLQDTFYVIKDSWETPESCDITNLGVRIPQAQLGCQEYTTQSNQTVYLKSFTKLCSEQAIGCQLVVDTRNSTSPLETSYNTTNDSSLDDVTVQADRLRAVVINESTVCAQENKGCSEVGIIDQVTPGFEPTLFIKNDPDRYDAVIRPILCKDEELGCIEAVNVRGERNFLKIDFTNTCSLSERIVNRQTPGGVIETTVEGWFRDQEGFASVGCSATPQVTQADCERNLGVWNAEWNQCTSHVQGMRYGDCSILAMDQELKNQLKNTCTSDHKGSWYDNGIEGCGCARYPFDYYKADEYPEHEVAAAFCAPQYDQCTGFVDFNPNYVVNGTFEQVADQNTTLASSWDPEFYRLTSGRVESVANKGKNSSRGILLTKTTGKDIPADARGMLYYTPQYITQTLRRLEKGKTYEVSVNYRVDNEASRGFLSSFDAGGCRLPEAAIEVVPALGTGSRGISSVDLLEYYARSGTSTRNPNSIIPYTDKTLLQVFQSDGSWQTGSYTVTVPNRGFTVPLNPEDVSVVTNYETPNNQAQRACELLKGTWMTNGIDIQEITNKELCNQAGYVWNEQEGQPEQCVSACSPFPETDSTLVDYEVRLYTPLNGVCVNKRTGQREYFDRQGRPLDKYTCEGLAENASEVTMIARVIAGGGDFTAISNNRRYNGNERYESYADRITSAGILDYDDLTALGQNDTWEWRGNCSESNVFFDNFQIAPDRGEGYAFINDQQLDSQSCVGVNWDAGCIQFQNQTTGEDVILRVKPDRQCSEWLHCEERNSEGLCLSWTTCKDQDGSECVQPGSLYDPVRYRTEGSSKELQPVTRDIYQTRFGETEGFRLNRWREGEYSGYTIPNIPALEQLYDALPKTKSTTGIVPPEYPNDQIAGSYAVSQSKSDEFGINVEDVPTDVDTNRLIQVCRGYPEATSPYPSLLKRLVPGFGAVSGVRGPAGDVAVHQRAGICTYITYTIASQKVHFTAQPTGGICIQGDRIGEFCTTDSNCYARPQSESVLGSCEVLGTDNNQINPSQFDPIQYQGHLGVCIEEDAVIKITGGVTGLPGSNPQFNQRATPRACLTFFPL